MTSAPARPLPPVESNVRPLPVRSPVRRTAAALLGAALALTAACAGARPEHAGHAAHAASGPTAHAVPRAAVAPAARDAGDTDYSLYDLPAAWRDQRGAEVRLPSLAGTVRVVAMVYTRCAATCPLIVADLKRIEASIPAARRDAVGFVLVSLDPERDTPDRMARWAERTALDPARWTLLAGDAGAVRELAAVLGVRYQPAGAGGDEVVHTNVITVLDPTGAVVHQQVGLGAATRGTVDAVRALLDRPAAAPAGPGAGSR